ncbi:hypothetical protein [Actinomadura bangladeshensis]|uniref:hypothetical protein n=1 Tax=Actinomadura bangladeshensis TaxID=453573 RepID=UPI001404FF21|nr:hypothetical protein [Actinomadura bangladeshensis]
MGRNCINGRWRLRIRHNGWSETGLCAGAEGTYAYLAAAFGIGTVTTHRYVSL